MLATHKHCFPGRRGTTIAPGLTRYKRHPFLVSEEGLSWAHMLSPITTAHYGLGSQRYSELKTWGGN